MPKHLKEHWRSWAIAFLVVFVACAVIFFSDAFQQCIDKSYYGSSGYQSEKSIAFIFGMLGLGRSCTGSFLKDNSEALTAFFTLILSGSTIGLWLSTKHLWSVTKEAVDLGNKEFIAAHRPKIRLKHAWFVGDKLAWRVGNPLEINLDFVNRGDGPAKITWVVYQSLLLNRGEPLPQRPPFNESPPDERYEFGPSHFACGITLPPGVTYARVVCDGTILSTQEVVEIVHGRKELYLIGSVQYLDDAGVRQTAFCRKLSLTRRFPRKRSNGGVS